MKYLLVALVLTAPVQAQECLTLLHACDACVLPDGGVALYNCGGTGSTCPPFPASLLTADPDVEPGSLHALLVSRAYARWTPGEPLYDVLTDPQRDFVRRGVMDVIRDNQAAIGSAAEFEAAGVAATKELVAECARHLTVKQIPDGTGGAVPRLVPRSTASRGRCSAALLGWLPDQLGPFTDAELSPFVELGLMAEPDDHDDDLLGLAAQLRELSPEDFREVVDHAALMGPDQEGGRE